MQNTLLSIILLPLLGSVAAGLFGWKIGRKGSHLVTIIGVATSCLLSFQLLFGLTQGTIPEVNLTLYKWAEIGNLTLQIGVLFDALSATMLCVITFVSLMVHIYTIGYMQDDPGYQRFFSYISLFTFAMLVLVLSNNFLQLFFGWEAVGVVSYLLIGFWFKKDSAVFANLKAFLINRIGDLGFLIGIAGVLYYFGSLDYAIVFSNTAVIEQTNPTLDLGFGEWQGITFICIALFIGAMGKSAQVPLHVWLPDSMEGPTPISALIHAATMVTAGVFMVARMSPLFELTDVALSFVLVIGSITAFFMGLLGVIQNDIKRVVAYSTLSQLGYMVAGLGVSAYAASIFHLMTHAFFKALLFLAAGSVIIGMHHQQDIRKMGNLKKYMPITYFASLLGTLALIGMPFFSGFYSKDAIIESVHMSTIAGSDFAYVALVSGVFFTALYSMRVFYLVFHTEERMDEHTRHHLQESPSVVWLPLIILAIPSVMISWWTAEPMLFGDFFASSITVNDQHNSLALLSRDFVDVWSFAVHGFKTLPFWLMVCGIVVATYCYLINRNVLDPINRMFSPVINLFVNKYYFDDFYLKFMTRLGLSTGKALSRIGDQIIIDGVFVNGSAKTIGFVAHIIRKFQTGYLYHYALVMVAGLIISLFWLYWPNV
ncbi:MAG: NADH-quinone oxidoreductase subunit L [Kangiellaceae bacterium]|jgi:NADH-quinone oxidoreductase subunit L|nr:NADH-quinone oxidoreductase subunit L [Kangiellaceae bacterium]